MDEWKEGKEESVEKPIEETSFKLRQTLTEESIRWQSMKSKVGEVVTHLAVLQMNTFPTKFSILKVTKYIEPKLCFKEAF